MDPAAIFTVPEAYADPESWHEVAARQPERFLNTSSSILAPISRRGPDATAGHDTTSSTLAGGFEAGIENAVEEMIRWMTPVRHFLRHAQEDYVLRGTQLRKGDVLLMSYLSANRDEDVFSDSLRFDVARENASEPLAFGTGVHFCLGALLARMELRAFHRELLPRLESVELTGPSAYTAATFVGAPKRVTIRYRLR